ncbi:ankyrin-3 [Nephila pilipes]|uniref:Alpha-latrotoxin n=1 Tax=Nephila pilipes TaxID=299642 RepID=A0A8X6N447_NEPPI|nr:ankyrin-3 [Nephila pilipes]
MASHISSDKDALLTLNSGSRKRLLAEFRKLDDVSAKTFCLNILNLMKEVIHNDNVDSLRNFSSFLEHVNRIKSEFIYYLETDQIGNFNLVALACQKKAIKVLEYLLSHQGKSLYNLIVHICESDHLLSDEDEFHHNALYYAIRSNLVGLLRILVDKWCEHKNSEQLEDVLSKEYKELKLRRVFLKNEMELYVHNKILDIRFYQDNLNSNKGSGNAWIHIQKRIEMVHRDIDFLKMHYWDTDPDDKFLVKAELIAKNIHTLKSLLKSTYDRLPWEEIEFILVIFILCCKNHSQTYLVYKCMLNKKKVLSYLESFSFALDHEERNLKTFDVLQLAKPIGRTKSIRDKVIKEITKNYSSFQELYTDYGRVRDFYSLETVKTYVDLAVTVDITKKEGQLVVMRALQVMGEHFKNTLESPKLSDSTAELLLYSLPSSTRNVITKLRDSLSREIEDGTHFIRTVIEKRPCIFFKNIQSDISKITIVITDLIYKIKTIAIQMIMKQVGSCKHLKDVEYLFGPFRLSIKSLIEEIKKTDSDTLIKGDIGKLEEMFSSLSNMMIDKTTYEIGLLEQINSIIEREKYKLFLIRNAFMYNVFGLNSIFIASQTGNATALNILREYAERYKILKLEEHVLNEEPLMKNIQNPLKQILECALSRTERKNDIIYIVMKIVHFMKFHIHNIKWMKELKGTFHRKKKGKGRSIPALLSPKIYLLQKILTDNNLVGSSLVTNISFFESNLESKTMVEMLVLDVLSIIQDSCNHNPFFLDSEYPLQVGKNLRNHLAHNNALINILLDKSPMQLLLNAIKLTNEDFSRHDKKIDKIILCDPSKLENNHTEDLLIVDNQRELFYGLENGDMKRIQDCIKKGADIYGKDINEMTCLHYSAKAPSTEAIEFVLQQGVDVAAKDLNDQTALHIAVKYDSINTVKYFIKTKLLHINDIDVNGKTPLHIAVENGSIKSLKYLLKKLANKNIKDYSGLSPLHSAIIRQDIKIVEILLRKEKNINKNLLPSGYTALHSAAEGGHIHLVNMLIRMKVDANCKTDLDISPLHVATQFGHLEVVKILIFNGADVNAKTLLDETPLHFAAHSGRKEIVELLLNHKAEVNASTLTFHQPLSFAALAGHVAISELLIKNNADVNALIDLGPNPLHLASQNGHLKLVKLLLNYGAFINQKNIKNDKGTALHYCSSSGHFEVVKLLIESGADLEAKNIHDSKPLHVAVERGYYEIAEILIANGADIHSKNSLGLTALHIAAYNRFEAIVKLLLSKGADFRTENKNNVTPIHIMISSELCDLIITNKSNIDFVDAYGYTTLHLGALSGNLEFVKYCLDNGCNINDRNKSGLTALHLASQGNHQLIVNYLIDIGAETNVKDIDGHTALTIAAKNNCQNITRILIEKTESISQDQIESLCSAAIEGHHDIVNIMLTGCIFDICTLQENYDLLHGAAENGHMNVVKVLLENGFEMNATRKGTVMTPLHCAVLNDHWETAQLLLLKAAYPNAQDLYGRTPLHYAAERGNIDLVESLLDENADIFIKDYKNKTVIELTVDCNQLEIFKLFFFKGVIDVDFKGYLDRSLLHQCALTGSLEMTEYLVESGANIHAKCRDGHKPIHLAAVMGFVKIVEFYLDHNIRVNDLNGNNLTLLHIASECGKANVAELLIKRSANINVSDLNGTAPIHLAALNGHIGVLEILIHNGAYYNVKNKLKQTPLQITKNESVASLLRRIEMLFMAVKNNALLDVQTQLEESAKNSEFCFINANCVENETALHYASRKGHVKVTESLLKHKADPNILNKNKSTPLHYAAEFSHFEIVKILLTNGAIYNALSYDDKIPLNCAVDQNIINLLVFLHKTFIKVRDNNISLLQDLDKMKDLSKVKAVMRAKNREGKTLIEFAILCNFSKTEQIKELFQSEIKNSMNLYDALVREEKFVEACVALKKVINKRIEIFGSDNPSVLDIQEIYVSVLCKQKKFNEALTLVEEIYQKRQESLGSYHKLTLAIKSLKASTLSDQEKKEEALNIYKEVIPKQKEILEPNDFRIIDSENGMALVLLQMEKYAEASKLNFEILEKCIKAHGVSHVNTLEAHTNLATTLIKQEKHAEALQILEKSFKISKTKFSLHHSNTLRILFNIACTLSFQKKFDESLKILKELLYIHKVGLPPNDLDILRTEYNIGAAFYYKGMIIKALRIFLALEPKVKMVCPNTNLANDNQTLIEKISFELKMQDLQLVFQRIQNEIKEVLKSGVNCPLTDLTSEEEDTDYLDSIGITALHLAVVNGDKNRINDLLENDFDVLKVTLGGNTALHTAAIHGYADIAEIIIRHTQQHKRSRLNDLINATNAGALSTALHVAANVDTATCLLKQGAKFDDKNKLDQTPLDLAGDERIFNLLKTIGDIFDSAVNGKWCVIDRIRDLDPEEALAVSRSRNSHGNTLLQVALMNNHRDLAKELVEFLKTLTKRQ